MDGLFGATPVKPKSRAAKKDAKETPAKGEKTVAPAATVATIGNGLLAGYASD
jgi:hypothetical protein